MKQQETKVTLLYVLLSACAKSYDGKMLLKIVQHWAMRILYRKKNRLAMEIHLYNTKYGTCQIQNSLCHVVFVFC